VAVAVGVLIGVKKRNRASVSCQETLKGAALAQRDQQFTGKQADATTDVMTSTTGFPKRRCDFATINRVRYQLR